MQEEGTFRSIKLAQFINVPVYIVHVMSGVAAEIIAQARILGQRVIGEAIASGIAADEQKIFDADFKVAHNGATGLPVTRSYQMIFQLLVTRSHVCLNVGFCTLK